MGERTHSRALRVEHGLNQTEMAKKLNVSLSTYYAIEKGKADGKVKFWELLKDTFKLSGEDICYLQEKKKTQEF